MSDITPIFVANLTKFAEQNDISLSELFRVAKINPNSFSRWKNGKVEIGLGTAQRIVERLNLEYGLKLEVMYFLLDSEVAKKKEN